MTTRTIQEQIEALEATIVLAKEHIKKLRGECDHSGDKRTFKYDSDTGNWSKSDDCYWVDISCTCGKKWHCDSVMNNWAYREPKKAILPNI